PWMATHRCHGSKGSSRTSRANVSTANPYDVAGASAQPHPHGPGSPVIRGGVKIPGSVRTRSELGEGGASAVAVTRRTSRHDDAARLRSQAQLDQARQELRPDDGEGAGLAGDTCL